MAGKDFTFRPRRWSDIYRGLDFAKKPTPKVVVCEIF